MSSAGTMQNMSSIKCSDLFNIVNNCLQWISYLSGKYSDVLFIQNCFLHIKTRSTYLVGQNGVVAFLYRHVLYFRDHTSQAVYEMILIRLIIIIYIIKVAP